MGKGSVRVLLVEDSPAEARLLKEVFQETAEPFDVTHAESLAEAERHLRSATFDAVLLDLSLPDSRGLGTLQQARLAAPELPILVLTGWDDEAIATEAIREGAQDYLLKGQSDPRSLSRAIRYAVERRRMEAERERHRQRLDVLMRVSMRIAAARDFDSLLQTTADAARELTGARLSVAGYGFADRTFTVGAASRAEDAPSCPEGKVFSIRQGGVYLDLVNNRESLRLTDEELRNHPMWQGLPEGHTSLRGLMGVRLTDLDGRPNAVIMVTDKREGDFTEEDETLLRQLGAVTSLALQHVEARTRAEKRAQEAEEGKRVLDVMTEELRTAKEAAEAANLAKSQFLANISHELRTPMTAILGMLDLGLGEELTPVLHDYLQTARNSADVLLSLLNELLDFSRIEAGRFALEPVPFQLREMLDQTVKTLAVPAYEKGLELACDVLPDVPEHLNGDSLRLRQVLTNLLGNAIKFTEKGEVIVGVKVESQTAVQVRLRFTVADTGIGISHEDQRRIFAPFAQADASTTRHYGGTGLGLAIVSSLTSLMGGMVEVQSEPGRGSTFTFAIDLALQATTSDSFSSSLQPWRGAAVLVIEAHPTSRRILERMLQEWSLRPVAAASPQTALAQLREAAAAGTRFPLVLLEAALLNGNNSLLSKELQERPLLARTVVLMLSPVDRSLLARQGRMPTVAAYLEKPVSQADLFRAIRTTLDGAASRGVAGAPVSAPEAARASAPRGLRILLAEDTPANQKLMVRLLAKRGHAVEVARNGEEAVALAQQGGFDVVLMDVQMPVMDGFQATAAIRKLEQSWNQPRLPIVAITAHAMKGDQERCLAAGMDGYLAKPVDSREMVDLIERLALRHQERRVHHEF